MKAREFIACLQEGDLDAEVLLSSDEEGNSYRAARVSTDEVAIDFYDGKGLTPVNAEDIANGEYDEAPVPVVVIW